MVKNFLQFIFESNDFEIEYEIKDVDGELVDEVVDKFSFIYKKIKERYLRPIKIEASNIDSNVKIEVFLSNNDIVKIKYYNNDELLVYINDKLVYHMDKIHIDEIVYKSANLYEKYLKENRFKIDKKTNPFD